MTFWTKESEIIIQAKHISIPESVPCAVEATAENCFDKGSGASVKDILNSFPTGGVCGGSILSNK
jgi:hypothetical protein